MAMTCHCHVIVMSCRHSHGTRRLEDGVLLPGGTLFWSPFFSQILYVYIAVGFYRFVYIYVLHMAIPFEYKSVLYIHRFGFAGSICVQILMHLQLQYIARGVCVHDVRSSLPKGHAHCQGRLAEVCCLLVENYFNSSQVWSSRSFLQFLKRLRPSKNSKY